MSNERTFERIRYAGEVNGEEYDFEVICSTINTLLIQDLLDMIPESNIESRIVEQYHTTEGILVANLEVKDQ